MNIDKTFQSAIEEYNKGALKQAENLSKKILIKKPRHADALNLLGMIAYEEKNYYDAINFIKQALQYNPDNFYFHNNLGTAFKAIKQLDDAIIYYRKALQLSKKIKQ